MTYDLHLALLRWSSTCVSTGSRPELGPFLAGWYLRRMGCESLPTVSTFRDSMRAGWSESGIFLVIEEREGGDRDRLESAEGEGS